MNSNPGAILRASWLGLVLLGGSLPLRAEQFGLFTYRVVGGTVEITDYPTTATGPVVIPPEIAGKPVTSVGDSAFRSCTKVTSVSIPSSVTDISSSAFFRCSGLTDVIIPSSVTSIGSNAFSFCAGLTSITIPSGTTSIGIGAFSNCTSLDSISVEAGNPQYVSDGGVLFSATRSTLFQYPPGKAGGYSIPSSVTSVDGSAFSLCRGLTSVTIPSSVASIGSSAFSLCTGLTSITIPSSVASIGSSAFRSCAGLTSVVIPLSVMAIGSGAFSNCTSLDAIYLEPGNAQYTSDAGVLLNATKTMLVQFPSGKAGDYIIPSSVTSIGSFGFSGCTGLSSLTIPSSVTSVGDFAFERCTGLTSVTIPSNVTVIGHSAFESCTGLSSVTIPSSVATIGDFAFFFCTRLTRAFFLGNAPSLGSVGTGEFHDAAPGFTIYYLSGRTGFTSPTWHGYPAVMIDEGTYPAASWLLGHELPYDTDLGEDSNGDGVSLLMAYALDLDPRLNLQGSLPAPVRVGDDLSLGFHAASPGITYRAETSTDLQTWTTDGVVQSAPGPDGRSAATVPLGDAQRFLRLAVEE